MDSTLMKGLLVMETLATSREPRGVTDLSRQLGLPKSNIHRTLQSLRAAGYVCFHEGGTYTCSLKLFELGQAVVDRVDVGSSAQSAMEQLSEVTRETVHLALLDGLEVLYLRKIESPEPVRAYSRVGGRAPAYCVASGKSLLAQVERTELERLPSPLPRYTQQTVADIKALSAELDGVRERGYAVNRGEWREEVGGVAAVVVGPGGRAEAALGISGPLTRIEPVLEQHIEAVLEAAHGASVAMGCSGYNGSFLGR